MAFSALKTLNDRRTVRFPSSLISIVAYLIIKIADLKKFNFMTKTDHKHTQDI